VIRDEPVTPKTYNTMVDKMIDLLLRAGWNYAIDNSKVYDRFSQLIIPRNKNVYIQPFTTSKDCPFVFMAIKTCTEGPTVKVAK
jgi:hypothetical protein